MKRITEINGGLRSINCFEFNLEKNEIEVIKRLAEKFIERMVDEGLNIMMMKLVLSEAREIIDELKPSK